MLIIFRISCAALATCWRVVEEWFAWPSRSPNCSGSISHAPRYRHRLRRTCRTTCLLSARQYNSRKSLSTRRERTRSRFTQLRSKEGWVLGSGVGSSLNKTMLYRGFIVPRLLYLLYAAGNRVYIVAASDRRLFPNQNEATRPESIRRNVRPRSIMTLD